MVRFRLRGEKVQLLEFEFPEGVVEPSCLEGLPIPEVDSAKPLVLSGRGPQWFYQYLVHQFHFVRILATFEPRIGKGIVVEAPSYEDIGKSLDVETGEIGEEKIGAKGKIEMRLLKLGGFQLLDASVKGDRFVEPSEMREIEWHSLQDLIDPSKPLLLHIFAPIWLGARIAAEFCNSVPWYAVYDPRIEGGVVIASHASNAPAAGKIVRARLIGEL